MDNPEGRPGDDAHAADGTVRAKVKRALKAVKAAQRDLNDAKRVLGRLLNPAPVTSRMPRTPSA